MIIMGKEHENKISSAMQPIFAFIYAVFIYNRHYHLWAFQHMLKIVIRCGHASEDVSENILKVTYL